MTFVWAFTGDNESRKNYFKAQIAWGLLWILIWGAIVAAGYEPSFKRTGLELTQKALKALPDPNSFSEEEQRRKRAEINEKWR